MQKNGACNARSAGRQRYTALQIRELDEISTLPFSQRQLKRRAVSSQSTRLQSQASSRNTSSKFLVRQPAQQEQRRQWCLDYLQQK